jgi:hypothetical protein
MPPPFPLFLEECDFGNHCSDKEKECWYALIQCEVWGVEEILVILS